MVPCSALVLAKIREDESATCVPLSVPSPEIRESVLDIFAAVLNGANTRKYGENRKKLKDRW